ncbi:MAG TPA: SDR family NAD(P)-dependent oxidoreductase, partial [Xanthobacteraceae bacterium]
MEDDPLASFRLDDRLIIVTGASQGIGRHLAEGFARAGAVVVLASRRADRLEEVRDAIVARGGRAVAVATDVTRLPDLDVLAYAVSGLALGEERRIVLVNNAGFGFTKAALEI